MLHIFYLAFDLNMEYILYIDVCVCGCASCGVYDRTTALRAECTLEITRGATMVEWEGGKYTRAYVTGASRKIVIERERIN